MLSQQFKKASYCSATTTLPGDLGLTTLWKEKGSMKQKELMVGVACGLVIGAAAALLLAPSSGAETRRKLRYKRDFATDLARDTARRTVARLRQDRPEPEEDGNEEYGAFSGA